MKINKKNRPGFIALSTVLIVSTVVLALSVSAALIAVDGMQSSLSSTKGEDALSFIEGCAEDGLLKSQASPNYNGGQISRPVEFAK